MFSYRYAENRNLRLHVGSDWQEIPVIYDDRPLIANYLESNRDVIGRSLMQYSRSAAFFITLTFPAGYPGNGSGLMSKLFESLSSQVKHAQLRALKAGKRVHLTVVRYVWVKEKGGDGGWHFHVCILMNRDAYASFGSFDAAFDHERMISALPCAVIQPPAINLAGRVVRAWASALRILPSAAIGLVHFHDNGVYYVDRKNQEFLRQFNDLFRRLSYFAKLDTKHYGGFGDSYGCSRI